MDFREVVAAWRLLGVSHFNVVSCVELRLRSLEGMLAHVFSDVWLHSVNGDEVLRVGQLERSLVELGPRHKIF